MVIDDVQIELSNNIALVRFEEGELNADLMQEVIQLLVEQMRYNNAQHFVFDMQTITFMSSACLGVLVQLLEDITPNRGRIAMAGCQENVEFLFKVTRLDQVFSVHEDIEEAIREVA